MAMLQSFIHIVSATAFIHRTARSSIPAMSADRRGWEVETKLLREAALHVPVRWDDTVFLIEFIQQQSCIIYNQSCT